MDFNFSYAPGTSLEQMITFEMAGGVWSSQLADDVTINIHIEMTDQLPEYVVGGALLGIQADQRYETWRNQLANDRTSADDEFAYQNQQNDADKFTVLIDGFKIDNNYELNMSRANAKALKMRGKDDSSLDGYILMNKLSDQSLTWDYDSLNNAVASGNVDFLSVALHEIGHTLGFYSGVDEPGWLTQKTQYDATHQSDFYATLIGTLNNATPLDMFRFSAESVQQASTSDSWIDLSIGGKPYFSTDGGKTALGYFATGEDTNLGGDGDQASHWKQDNSLGIMDPVLRPGQRRSISTLDQQALDVIGWDANPGGVDLATLYNQAKERLAQRIGVTVDWLDANPQEASQRLIRDRTQDVYTMIDQSKVYNWRRSSGSGWWQTLWQGFLWSEVDLPTEPASVRTGSLSHDHLKGDGNRNKLVGRAGNDTLEGSLGDDELLGDQGRDLLKGGQGSDVLIGTEGQDKLIGGEGNDTLIGGFGGDVLVGGAGQDRFVYQSVRDRGDRIRDFDINRDLLDFSQIVDKFDRANPDLLNQVLQLKQVGSDTVIQAKLGNDFNSNPVTLVTLSNVAAADLDRVASQAIIL
ncbi:MAG: hypothetical protein HC769_29095 [Cyanobacteria bacterium CRU_2_1]|nr:hypothetical protein [Cyanobacteria bacterium RU_5_0]NJR62505.1 hypothetical protein [Cyanobacteria bacterium CRU_2_1]